MKKNLMAFLRRWFWALPHVWYRCPQCENISTAKGVCFKFDCGLRKGRGILLDKETISDGLVIANAIATLFMVLFFVLLLVSALRTPI